MSYTNIEINKKLLDNNNSVLLQIPLADKVNTMIISVESEENINNIKKILKAKERSIRYSQICLGSIFMLLLLIFVPISISFYMVGCSDTYGGACDRYQEVDITIYEECQPYGYYYELDRRINCHLISTTHCSANPTYHINDTIKVYTANEGTCKTKEFIESSAYTGFSLMIVSLVIFLIGIITLFLWKPNICHIKNFLYETGADNNNNV